MAASALEEHSVPITFVATILFAGLALIVAVWPAAIPFDLRSGTGPIYATATLAFALILAAVSGNSRPTGDLDVADRPFLIIATELIIWACAPVAIIFQQHAPDSGKTVTVVMAALFVMSAIALMFHIKAMRGCSFVEVVLIPITATSSLLLAGGSWVGSGFLESAIPGNVLNTNASLRVILAGAAIIWIVAGGISGLRDDYPKFRNVLAREGAGRNLLVTIDVFIQFSGEVLISLTCGVVKSLLKIVNGRTSITSLLLNASIFLWILVISACERFSQDGPSYFSSHEHDFQVVVYFIVFIMGVVISALVDELNFDENTGITGGIERASRFVPIFSSVTTALLCCSFISLIAFEIVKWVPFFASEAALTIIGGFAPAFTASFLVIALALLAVRYTFSWAVTRT